MKNFWNMALLACLLLFAQRSLAVSCQLDGISSDMLLQVDGIAIARELPKGTIIWRSPDYHVSGKCWQDKVAPLEYIHLHLGPYDAAQTDLGPHLEIGVNLKDWGDTRYSDTSGGRIDMNWPAIPACDSQYGCKNQAQAFKFSFNVFLSKKSQPAAGGDGPIGAPSVHMAFLMDGFARTNWLEEQNFRMTLMGINLIRYVGCSSLIDINPRVLDFGSIAAAGMQVNKPIKELALTVTATKKCASRYGLDANFRPTRGSLLNGYTLVPDNNDSVGIKLFKGANKTPVQFDTKFELVPVAAPATVTVTPFTAQLLWLKNTATLGAFNAAATLEIYYK